MQEGIMSLMQMAKISAAVKRHVDIPRRSIIMVIYPHEYIIIVTITDLFLFVFTQLILHYQ